MVKQKQEQEQDHSKILVIGNCCHDVLYKDNKVIAETLGGAASFVSNVLDGLSINCNYITKVGVPDLNGNNQDRVLKRVHACDPIRPNDLPEFEKYDFGLAIGVGGEILPETLERMLDLCRVVFVDIQALIRVFDNVDGTVKHVGLKESGFWHLLPRIGFVKASAEEAGCFDLEEVRKWCCVVVTDGKDGCRVYWKDGEMGISPFVNTQVDPTGAGDSFLGGLVAGLIWGLDVADAALIGNFFGSLTVGQIGLPKFELSLLQRVKDEVLKRKLQCAGQCETRTIGSEFRKSLEHEDLYASLAVAAKLLSTHSSQEHQCNIENSPDQAVEQSIQNCSNGEQKLSVYPLHEEPSQTTIEDQTRHTASSA